MRRTLLPTLLLALLLAACSRPAPEPVPVATVAAPESGSSRPFALLTAVGESHEGRPAAVLTFSRPLAGAQKFDELLAITLADGAAPNGAWALDADGVRLRFPYLEADKTYVVTIRGALSAAGGETIGAESRHEVYTGPLQPLLGFASQGIVLPAHERRGLPIVTVNVPEVDVEFLRVRDTDVARFLAEYQRNGRRWSWTLGQLSRLAEPVYANRFAIAADANARTLTYLPVRDIDELAAPGLYFAVMKRPGSFEDGYDTAMFFVSDIGLHVRAYRETLLVHAASLKTGEPLPAVSVSLRKADGTEIAKAETDGQGLAKFATRLDSTQLLVASWGRDLTFLAFNQPALDLTEFAIAGRPQREAEVFPWSGRDLYRPGETVNVAALLRDSDGRAMPAQPLFATLRQPDGRVVLQQRIEPSELGAYAFSRAIALDAPTGRWSVDFATDPEKSSPDHAFRFRVEEFLPERLKLELASEQERLAPGEDLSLSVAADYLYGAPAAGNRFSAKLAVAYQPHPIPALADFHFGDPLVELPKDPQDAVDAALDDSGRLQTAIDVLPGTTVASPVKVVVQGSVFETGGRAVSRNLERTIWPASELVGLRPLFDLAEGSPSNGNAGFEVVRGNAAGELLAAAGLKVKVVRERRDYNWTWVDNQGWRADFVANLETIEERTLDVAAGSRARLDVPVEWGPYRVEITDPATGMVTRLPFQAGWGWDDNRGDEARPDKVKVALDKAAYADGDTVRATLTPPHEGPALVLLEGDGLLWHATLNVRAGTVVEIPLDPSWRRHDLYLSAIVFRPGSSSERITPNRAVGVAHVRLDRSARSTPVSVEAPDSMRPGNPLAVTVKAPALAGRSARVRVTAVDLGVLNITRFALPDAGAWFFAQRRLGVEAHDLYGRVVESLDGGSARLRFGGDMALPALPQARRPNAEVRTVDLFEAPVALDANGEATVSLAVPDFNGTLRVRALVFADDAFGAAERDSIVRAPLVAEASTPRVMAMGDRSQLTLDLTNLSGAAGAFRIAWKASGPIAIERNADRVELADGAKRTLSLPLRATGAWGVAEVSAAIEGGGLNLERRFRFAVRPPWPAVTRVRNEVLASPRAVAPDGGLLDGLLPDSVVARIGVGTLPPLPFAASARDLLGYPYGCIEQTTSKAFPLVLLDPETSDRLGLDALTLPARDGTPRPLDPALRGELLDAAFARIASMQTDGGHFAMWPGDTQPVTSMTPYVAEMLLIAREAGQTIPERVLDKALSRLNEDLLSGGNTQYQYEHYEHLRLAEMAHAGYVLARVGRAPVGTLRALFDNERGKLVGALPLMHLAAAFKAMGDVPRAEKAAEEAFGKSWKRPEWLGDYGSELRDLGVMLALAQEAGLAKPEYAARAYDLARTLSGESGVVWFSTQDQLAILRLGKALAAQAPRSFAASVAIGGDVSESTGRALVSRAFDPAQLAAGVRITPSGGAPLYATTEVTGIPRRYAPTERTDFRITRRWFNTDGTPWQGGALSEGQVLVAHLKVESANPMRDALVVDLLPGGLEVENLNLTDASQWASVTIDGVALSERAGAANIRFEEYRDDRYVAALELYGGSAANLFYLVRAVSPGDFVVPPPMVEDMYRPALRAVGTATPERVAVAR
jgi:uncharacterized protein YfaS (alpha-2-macroglobulin family)